MNFMETFDMNIKLTDSEFNTILHNVQIVHDKLSSIDYSNQECRLSAPFIAGFSIATLEVLIEDLKRIKNQSIN